MENTKKMDQLAERLRSIQAGYAIERNGLTLAGPLDFAQWAEIGRAISARIEGSVWALGDWLVEGGRETRGWLGGSSYEKASKITGYSKAHLSNAFRASSAFPRDARHPDLSCSAHREVLRLPEAQRQAVLRKAAERRWSADDVAEHINGLIEDARPADPVKELAIKQPSRVYYQSPEVRCPHCNTTFPIKGHKVAPREKPSRRNSAPTFKVAMARRGA
jgi:hypothetical protein